MRYRAVGIVLGTLACDGGVGSNAERPPAAALPPAVVVVTDRDLDAYAAGTRATIRGLRLALEARDTVDWATIDSVAAGAARMPVERFHAVSAAVATALKERRVIAGRQERLDSLRVELMLLQVRTQEQP